MALPGTITKTRNESPAVIAFHILEADLISKTEIRRAPDDPSSPGSPLLASASTIAILERVGTEPFVDYGAFGDEVGVTTTPYYYQVRHTLPGREPSAWYPTDWKKLYATQTPKSYWPAKPPYPTVYLINVDSAQKYGQVDPQNVLIRMSPGYYHPDTQIYYDYFPLSASVPAPSLTDGSWTLLGPSGSTGFLRDQSDPWLVAAFAEINGIIGPVSTITVSPDMTPTIGSLTQWQVGDGLASGAVVLGQAMDVDAQTERVRVYRRVGNWPTDDGNNTGNLSESFYRGELVKNPFIFETPNLKTDDIVYDMWVPVDANGIENIDGVVTASITVQGSSPANPQFTSVTVTEITQGTSFVDPATYAVTASTADVTDGTHDIKVYRLVIPEESNYQLIDTITTPVSTPMFEVDGGAYYTGGKYDPLLTIRFRFDLVDTSNNVDDTAIKLGSSFIGVYTPV